MATLLIAEHDNATVKDATAKALTAAKALGGPVHILVAGEGAKMSLLSMRERAGALALLDQVTYVELSDRPDFNDRFIELLAFPV